jgi:NitT/TauT family transport system permease protein
MKGTALATTVLTRIAAIVLLLVLWEWASANRVRFGLNFSHVPAPSEVWAAAHDFLRSPKAVRHVVESSLRVLTGFLIAAAVAIPLGLIAGRSRFVSDVVMTPLEILRPIPGVAWIPLAILMFTSSEQSMVFVCFIGALFPILLSTIHGVESLDQQLIHAARSLGAGPWSVFSEVILPAALPTIVTGLTIGMGTCWFLVVTAEMIAGQFGIGYATWEAYSLQNYPSIVVGMAVIGILGMVSSVLVRALGRLAMPWWRPAK